MSGYTNSGISKLTYELASQLGFVTIGFSTGQALTVKSGMYTVDKVFLVGKNGSL